MSDQIAAKVEAQFEELAAEFGVEVEDLTLTIEDGPMTTSIAGSKLVTEGDDESENTTEGGDDESEDISEADEDTTEGGDDVEIHFEEMNYNELQKLASEELAEFPEDSSKAGLVEALSEAEFEDISEADDDQSKTEDTTEGGDDEEDSISDAELVEMGVKKSNIEDVREYRSKNGVCQTEDCPYGANDGEDHCASHQGSSSKSKTSEDSPKGNREMSDLSEAEKNLVSSLISDEGKSLEEAISMV